MLERLCHFSAASHVAWHGMARSAYCSDEKVEICIFYMQSQFLLLATSSDKKNMAKLNTICFQPPV